MNNRINYKKINIIIEFAYIFIIVFVIYLAFKYLFNLLIPFIVGTIICLIAEPTVSILQTKLKIKRSLSSVICIIIILTLFSCIVLCFSAVLINQIKNLISQLPDFREILNEISQKSSRNLLENILLYLKDNFIKLNSNNQNQNDIFNNIIHYSSGLFKTMPQFITTIIVTLAFSIILSSSFPMVKSFIKKKVNLKNQQLLNQVKICTITILKKYFKSYSILLFITFCELLTAFLIFKIKPAFALAFVISLVDILPIFGIGTILIPWSVILLTMGEYSYAAVILSIYTLLTIVRQIIEPKIVGDNIGLPPVITLPIMFIGLNLFGIIGLFAAPPIATIIYSLYKKGCIKIWR